MMILKIWWFLLQFSRWSLASQDSSHSTTFRKSRWQWRSSSSWPTVTSMYMGGGVLIKKTNICSHIVVSLNCFVQLVVWGFFCTNSVDIFLSPKLQKDTTIWILFVFLSLKASGTVAARKHLKNLRHNAFCLPFFFLS